MFADDTRVSYASTDSVEELENIETLTSKISIVGLQPIDKA
jgi:hypothetical protein